MLVKPTHGVDFTNMFTKSFYGWRSQNCKKVSSHQYHFVLLGSALIKAWGKALRKLAPDDSVVVLIQFWKKNALVCCNWLVFTGRPLSEPVEEIGAWSDFDVSAKDADAKLTAGFIAVAVAVTVAAEEVAWARAAAEERLFAATLALSDWNHEVKTLMYEKLTKSDYHQDKRETNLSVDFKCFFIFYVILNELSRCS